MTDRIFQDTPQSADFWRFLLRFNLYRLALVSFLVFLPVIFGHSFALGSRNWKLFFAASILYAAAVVFSLIWLKLRRTHFNWQLAGQIGSDIVGLSVLSYASGGIQSGIGLLLLASLVAAGMVRRSKITLFFAALASIAALLEHSYAVLYDDAAAEQYIQVGLLCMSYFAVAWLARTLARYAVDSQKLAQRREYDLVSLAEANRLVMRDMQDGVLVVDELGMIMQMNPSAERMLHKSIGPGSALSDNFPTLFGQYAMWKQTGEVSRDTLQLGAGLQAKLRFFPIERDTVRGVLIFLEDMQRVRAEAQQIKLAALGRLTANIAHEVRNPLSAISYATELLQEEQGNAGQQRLLNIVLENTQRINQIVQDVMQLNRRDRAQPEILDLGAVLQAFVEEFELAERLEPGLMVLSVMHVGTVSFDRCHLRQILWNLCGNALRYGRGLPGSLTLSTSVQNDHVVLAVRDDGPGVPEEHQGKLFEPFFTTATEGTGLGLYIARELCEANRALLEYQVKEGPTGACFIVTFGELRRDGRG